MIHISIKIFFVLAAIKWGDWKHWKKYYPTIQFFIIGDLFYNLIFRDYPLWKFKELYPIMKLDIIIMASFMIVRYPATVFIYLGKFPNEKSKAILWYLFWVLLYIGIEIIDLQIGLIKHFNSWNIWWSLLFDMIIFAILKIHFHKPLLAWGLALLCSIILWNLLEVPIHILK